jgi:nitrate/nitrite-specific signal transduction histidine kinase
MRERSELMGGQIVFSRPAEGGTLMHLDVPREKAESYGKEDHSVAGG